jgi:hypothetical protein
LYFKKTQSPADPEGSAGAYLLVQQYSVSFIDVALRRKAVSACNCKGYKKKIARDFICKSLAINKF